MADAMADEAQKPGLNASHAAVNAQGLKQVTLIPRPSDDPRDPLVSFPKPPALRLTLAASSRCSAWLYSHEFISRVLTCL